MKKGSSTTRTTLFMILLLCCFPTPFLAQPTAITGTVNSYGAVTLVDTTANTVLLANPAFSASLAVNDLVLIYQTQGASIQTGTVNSGFGTISSINGAGSFEFGRVCSIDGTDVAIDNKLVNTYFDPAASDASIQMIKVPEYSDAEVTGTLTADAWDGDKGGILALSVLDTLYINGTIDLSEKGFRGGTKISNVTAPFCNFTTVASNYAYPSPQGAFSGAAKGEGIAVFTAGQEYGRGPQANGGGGGNGHNAGGAGGGNGGDGGAGGERVASIFSCQGIYPGLSGKSLATSGYSVGTQRAFLGGGGGAGDDNNGASGDGGNGGGLVLILANVITGTGSIETNGGTVTTIGSDGNAGGGAGGSILLNANIIDGAGLTFSATGGNGGRTSINCEGPGGGGSGGVIWSSVGLGGATTQITGGTAGQATACANNTQGATNGSAGQVLTSGLAPPQGTNPVPCILETPIILSSISQAQTARLFWESPGSTVQAWFLQEKTESGNWERIRSFVPAEGITTVRRGAESRTFRIEALDPDGLIRFSNQVEIEATGSDQFTAVVLQNQGNSELRLGALTPREPVFLTIYEPSGKVIQKVEFIANSSQHDQRLSTPELSSGYYLLSIRHEGVSTTLPLLIIR